LKNFSDKLKIIKVDLMRKIIKKMINEMRILLQRSLKKKSKKNDHENLKTDQKSGYQCEIVNFHEGDING
jgi:hypothetical protein